MNVKETGSRIAGNILDEFKNVRFGQEIKNEYKDLTDFYLDEEKKKKLKHMGKFKRFFYQSGYLASSIYYKLTPIRRLLVVIGLFFILIARSSGQDGAGFGINQAVLGGLLILFVLILELKDKLLATEELKAGQKVQQALMPAASPDVPGWDIFLYSRSANEVSGDLIDFLNIDDNRYAVSIADVAGKGLSAALLTAKLQSTIRAFIDESVEPSQLVTKTNKVFNRDSLPNLFASLIYIELTSNSGKIKFANAGHFPPVIIRSNEIVEMEKGDAAVGLIQKASFRDFDAELKSGDIFIAYSDGVVETVNGFNEFYSFERFKSLLTEKKSNTSKMLGREIITALELFRGEAKVFDDISFIILRKK